LITVLGAILHAVMHREKAKLQKIQVLEPQRRVLNLHGSKHYNVQKISSKAKTDFFGDLFIISPKNVFIFSALFIIYNEKMR